jgi:hypothetical protein
VDSNANVLKQPKADVPAEAKTAISPTIESMDPAQLEIQKEGPALILNETATPTKKP